MFNYNPVNNNTTNQSYMITTELRKNTLSHHSSKEAEDISDSIIKIMNKTYDYVIEGGYIKIYLVVNGIKKQCIKSIPFKDANASILAKVDNLTMLDIMTILDMIDEKKHQEKEETPPSKAIVEYCKHLDTDDDCMNVNLFNL